MECTASTAPVMQLKTNKRLLKTILLGLLTFGIYPLVVWSDVSRDINIAASRYDGRHTKHFCLMCFLLAPLTLGIWSIVWYHQLSDRISAELRRRDINYSLSAGTFWGWGVFGSLLLGIGWLVYTHKVFKAINLINDHFNTFG